MRFLSFGRGCSITALALLLIGWSGRAAEPVSTSEGGLWIGEPGNGFKSTVQTLTLEGGVNYGLAAFGSRQAHHLALTSLSYGHMLSGVRGGDTWHRGNWEWRAELFGGTQFSPEHSWLVGLTPHLRYNFAVGSRIVPFFDLGAGVTATGIREPDLSNGFEFNLQAIAGVHWFLCDHVALTADARYFHMSCAGITRPNLGLNGVAGMLGLIYFF